MSTKEMTINGAYLAWVKMGTPLQKLTDLRPSEIKSGLYVFVSVSNKMISIDSEIFPLSQELTHEMPEELGLFYQDIHDIRRFDFCVYRGEIWIATDVECGDRKDHARLQSLGSSAGASVLIRKKDIRRLRYVDLQGKSIVTSIPASHINKLMQSKPSSIKTPVPSAPPYESLDMMKREPFCCTCGERQPTTEQLDNPTTMCDTCKEEVGNFCCKCGVKLSLTMVICHDCYKIVRTETM